MATPRRAAWAWSRARDRIGPHLPARPPNARGARPQVLDAGGRRRSSWAFTASGVSRAVATWPRNHGGSAWSAAARRSLPRTSLVATGRTRRSSSPPGLLARPTVSPGCRRLLDDRRGVSPGVVQGLQRAHRRPTTIVVVSRGLASRTVESSRTGAPAASWRWPSQVPWPRSSTDPQLDPHAAGLGGSDGHDRSGRSRPGRGVGVPGPTRFAGSVRGHGARPARGPVCQPLRQRVGPPWAAMHSGCTHPGRPGHLTTRRGCWKPGRVSQIPFTGVVPEGPNASVNLVADDGRRNVPSDGRGQALPAAQVDCHRSLLGTARHARDDQRLDPPALPGGPSRQGTRSRPTSTTGTG